MAQWRGKESWILAKALGPGVGRRSQVWWGVCTDTRHGKGRHLWLNGEVRKDGS